MKILSLLIFSIFLSCASGKTVPIKEDKPLMDYEPVAGLAGVLDKAAREGKIVFLDLYTDWCLPCKVMDEEVFEDQATAEFMNKNFINYKVNAEKGEGPDLTVIYEVKGYPTHLFLDSRGRIIEKNLGALGLVSFNVLAERALAAGTKEKEN
jgi:thiol:disulfide interchange protein